MFNVITNPGRVIEDNRTTSMVIFISFELCILWNQEYVLIEKRLYVKYTHISNNLSPNALTTLNFHHFSLVSADILKVYNFLYTLSGIFLSSIPFCYYNILVQR